ncbi:MAG: YIP1 family protein [Haloferacaceae archaeon]
MTTWVERPEGGRDRGPRGIARAWAEVLVHPRRFFRNGVAPGDQAPGLVFGVLVATAYTVARVLTEPGPVTLVTRTPGGERFVQTVPDPLVVLAVVVVVAPAALHLVSALQTVLLMLSVPDRGGVSETVQVVAYATAPCALAGLPIPGVRAVCAGYGAVLLVVGLREVHGASLPRAALAATVPAALVFGAGFGGSVAVATLLGAR